MATTVSDTVGLLDGGGDGLTGEHLAHVTPVVVGRVHVVGRVDVGDGGVGGVGRRRSVGERLLGRPTADWGGAHPEEGDGGLGHAVAVEPHAHGCTGDGEVAVTAGHLLHRETARTVPYREAHGGEDLVGAEGGGPRTFEKR